MAKPPTAQQVREALERLANGTDTSLKVIQVAYLTDWEAFDKGWREFYAGRPEDDPVVERIRAEMGKLS